MTISKRRLVAVVGIALAAGSLTAAQAGAPTAGGWAIVQSDGTLGANLNVTDVSRPKTGVYRITFNQDVSKCAANATIAAAGGKTIVPGYLVAGRNDNVPNQIRVYTFTTVTLLPANYKFDLTVSC
jgi:opacity protein-like surface antigen